MARTFMVPGREPFGKDAMKNARMTGTSDIRKINVLGDCAYVRNHIDITITPPGRNVMRHSGYTLSILRKQSNGKWVLWSLIA
jgi:ketosteroid isomerase-like protein